MALLEAQSPHRIPGENWSPDGSKVAYVSGANQRREILIADAQPVLQLVCAGLILSEFTTSMVALVLALTVALVGGTACSGSKPDRPNVLWITVEDMSPSLGAWGDPYAQTPNLDRLAAESVRYTEAFATAPVCSPSRSTLITGVYATSLGTQRLRSRFPIPAAIKGFPSYLRAAGYYTTNNVKTDYNTSDEARLIGESWNESSETAHWRGRAEGQPFFAVFNDLTTHQSRSMSWSYEEFQEQVQSRLTPGEIHDPEKAPVPPYYPDTPIVRADLAKHYDNIAALDRLIREKERAKGSEKTGNRGYPDSQ